jgi:hypothetical protein
MPPLQQQIISTDNYNYLLFLPHVLQNGDRRLSKSRRPSSATRKHKAISTVIRETQRGAKVAIFWQ